MKMLIYACEDEAASVSECCVCYLSVAAHFLSLTYGDERTGQKDGSGHTLTPSALV